MGIEGIPYGKGRAGASSAKIICDDCGAEDSVPCAYSGKMIKGEQARPNENQARSKAIHMGWSYVKNKLRCGTCEKKRKGKVTEMQKNPTELAAAPEPKAAQVVREPTKRQRIEIFTLLAEVYDIDAGRYQQGDTDETVAGVLDVMPGWVSQIREAEFGPDGGNENIIQLANQIDAMDKDVAGIKGDCDAIKKDCASIIAAADIVINSADRKLAEVRTMRADLEKIKKAVGPRILGVAGVR